MGCFWKNGGQAGQFHLKTIALFWGAEQLHYEQTNETLIESSPMKPKQKCGIVMPISACDPCSEQHWSDVKTIITDAVEDVGFTASLVSDADDVGIIQKRIIQNLYENPIVVCDVSAKNPNVMFELGMRLAFDKPTIIVKDDKTSYSFDTSPIEHLEYPRDLRFAKIVEFKRNLGEKVKATVKLAESDENYTTFLKHFGKFTVAKLETADISKEDYIIEELQEFRREFRRMIPFHETSGRSIRRLSMGNESVQGVSRLKILQSIIEKMTIKFLDKDLVDKGAVSKAELVMRITQELHSQFGIQQLADSSYEIEEIVETTINKFLP